MQKRHVMLLIGTSVGYAPVDIPWAGQVQPFRVVGSIAFNVVGESLDA